MFKIIFQAIVFVSILFGSLHVSAMDEFAVKAAVERYGGVEKFLKSLASELSKIVPHKVDAETMVISFLASGSTMNITHKLINIESRSDFGDQKEFDKFIDKFIKFQSNKVCTSSMDKVLINEYDATYRYQYLGNTEKSVMLFDVTKRVCATLK